MTFAETVAMLRRDGYIDAADIMENQAMQILYGQQALRDNEALLKQLKIAMEDVLYYKGLADQADELRATLEEVTTELNQYRERMVV